MAGTAHLIPELDRKGLRDFGLTTGGIVAVIFGLFFPWVLDYRPTWEWPWILCGILVAWALIAPMTMNGLYRVWMRFGLMMSKIMTPLVLGLVFYLMFAPMGLVMRLFGKDAMRREFDDNEDTYRVPSKQASVKNLEKPY